MIGVTRGISTLAGAAVAGVLLWFATQIGAETLGEYWATYGLIAAAGLTMALSQILGGWTKWGWPRFSRRRLPARLPAGARRRPLGAARPAAGATG